MFWRNRGLIDRDVKEFKNIYDQMINHKGFISRLNAKRELKNILNILYPEEHQHMDKDGWDDYLYIFTKEGYEEALDYHCGDLEDLTFYKKDACIVFLYELRSSMAHNQINESTRKIFYEKTNYLFNSENERITILNEEGLI